jgi:hypothetical protein
MNRVLKFTKGHEKTVGSNLRHFFLRTFNIIKITQSSKQNTLYSHYVNISGVTSYLPTSKFAINCVI